MELELNTDSVCEVREECMGLELVHPGSLNRLEMLPNLLGSFEIHRFIVKVACGCRDSLISCLAVSKKFHGCCLFLWSQRACGYHGTFWFSEIGIPHSVVELCERLFDTCELLKCATFGTASNCEHICSYTCYRTAIEWLFALECRCPV